MIRSKPGDVILIRFPFTDLSASKMRPALVLSPSRMANQSGSVLVLAMTSQPQRESRLRLVEWKLAGLPKPTWLKPVLGTLAASLVVRRLGRLHSTDLPRAQQALRLMIDSAFLK